MMNKMYFGHRLRVWEFASVVIVLGLGFFLFVGTAIRGVQNPPVTWAEYAISAFIVGYFGGITITLLLFSIADKLGLETLTD